MTGEHGTAGHVHGGENGTGATSRIPAGSDYTIRGTSLRIDATRSDSPRGSGQGP